MVVPPSAVTVRLQSARRAREEGITTFTAPMFADNHEMMDCLMALAPVRVIDRELGTVEIEMPIPKVGLSPGAAQAAVRRCAQRRGRAALRPTISGPLQRCQLAGRERRA